MAEKYGLILFKVPIYANYNIVVYSSNENFIDKFSDNILNLKNSIFNIENIDNFENLKNFLLV